VKLLSKSVISPQELPKSAYNTYPTQFKNATLSLKSAVNLQETTIQAQDGLQHSK
jgi:hypothetical protein